MERNQGFRVLKNASNLDDILLSNDFPSLRKGLQRRWKFPLKIQRNYRTLIRCFNNVNEMVLQVGKEKHYLQSYTIRLLPPVRDVVGAMLSLFKHFRWKRAFIVTAGSSNLHYLSFSLYVYGVLFLFRSRIVSIWEGVVHLQYKNFRWVNIAYYWNFDLASGTRTV